MTDVILNKQPGKEVGVYIIIPNTELDIRRNERKKFFLKLFASEAIEVDELPETIELNVPDISLAPGIWNEENSGGRLRKKVEKEKHDEEKDETKTIVMTIDNPNWCRNPQYLINILRPTSVKIILRRTKALRKKEGTIGLTICRYTLDEETTQTQEKNNKGGNSSPMRAQTQIRKKTDATQKLLFATSNQLQPTYLSSFERKLMVGTTEFCAESQFSSHDLAAMYFEFNPIEGPFIVVPSTDKEQATGEYRLTFYANTKIEVNELDTARNQVLISSWSKYNSGGCHLYTENKKEDQDMFWAKNQTFRLLFESATGIAHTKVTLTIAEKNWKKELSDQFKKEQKNIREPKVLSEREKTSNLSIGCMIGIYLLKGDKVDMESVVHIPTFLPVSETSVTFDFNLAQSFEYLIMPTTYYVILPPLFSFFF